MKFFDNLLGKIKQKTNRFVRNYVSSSFYSESLGLVTPNDFYSMVNAYKSWVYICSTRNSTNIASVPLKLYVSKRRNSKKSAIIETKPVDRIVKNFIFSSPSLYLLDPVKKAISIEEVVDHPFLTLLKNVNSNMNRFDLMESTELYLELIGNSYWYIYKNDFGIPQEIWLLPGHQITIIPDKEKFVKGYVFRNGLQAIPFDASEIIHFKFPSPSSLYYGASPLSAVINAYNTSENIARYADSMFKNMGMPEGILWTEQELSEEEFERMKTTWKETYGGVGNASKTAVLEKGLQYKPISFTPRELGFLIGRKMTVAEIASAYGLPMSKVTSEDVNLANAYVGERQYQKDTILPRLRRIEEKLNEQLIPLYDGNIFCAFDNPIAEDKELELREREINLRTGYSNINELRSREGLPPVEWGDDPILPSGSLPFRSSGQIDNLAQQIANSIRSELMQKRKV